MQDNIKAALYIRVSTEEQAVEGQSVQAQMETLKQYCNAFGIEIFDIYSDLGISGKRLKDRLELSRLLEDCKKRQFSLVLVWKISRLSRNLKDLLYLIDIFESNNVHFTSCSEKFDTSTPVGRMTLQLLGSIAEFERNTIVENVKLGLTEYARTGGKASAVFGYDSVNKKLEINESEARIVKLIFNLYVEARMNYTAIAKHLNSLCCKTKQGGEFRCGNISYILHNPVYIGINRHLMNSENSYSIKGAHTPIIDSVTWNKAQKISSKVTRRKYRVLPAFAKPAFQVICMKCSTPMRVFYAFSKGRKYTYYRCSSCSNYINVEKLMKEVSRVIIDAIENKYFQKSAYNLISKYSSNNEMKAIELAAVEAEIKRLAKSKVRYLSLFEGYKLSDPKAFVERISEIETQLKALENKKLEINNTVSDFNAEANSEAYFIELKHKLSAMEPEALSETAASLVKSIEAYKGKINVVLYL